MILHPLLLSSADPNHSTYPPGQKTRVPELSSAQDYIVFSRTECVLRRQSEEFIFLFFGTFFEC